MGLISSIINILFEVWFVYYNVIKIKKIENKKKIFFITTLISYILSSIIIGFTYKNQIFLLILMTLFIYLFMKLIYKKKVQITDCFLVYYMVTIIYIVAVIFQLIFGYTILSLLLNRLCLLLIALFGHKIFSKIYKICITNWNRGNNHKIKSITMRNWLILGMNLTIFLINTYILCYFLNLLK